MSDNTKLELPNHLTLLLATLISHSEITSWNIYENQLKNTCITIRLSDNCPSILPSKYRKISERQVLRNAERAKRFKPVETDMSKKRKLDKCSPELPRINNTYTHNSLHLDTPESVYEKYALPHADLSRDTTLTNSSFCQESVRGECHTVSPIIQPQIIHNYEPLPISYMENTQCDSSELVFSPMTYTVEQNTVILTDHTTSPVIMDYVPIEPRVEYVYQDPIQFSYSSASIIPQICYEPDSGVSTEGNCTEEESPSLSITPMKHDSSKTVLCPCCEEIMTTGHTCDMEDDLPLLQNTHESVSSTLVQSPSPSQPPPEPPDPYLRMAEYLNAQQDKMIAEFILKLN